MSLFKALEIGPIVAILSENKPPRYLFFVSSARGGWVKSPDSISYHSEHVMRVPHVAKAAPIGAASLAALTVVAVCSLAFRVAVSSTGAALAGQWPVAFIIVAYLLFSPAVACGLYSLLFERPKAPGVAALAVGLLTVFIAGILLDGLLLLPFWFLGVAGLSKLLRRRAGKITEEHFWLRT
jgi:hypothetical protein